MSASPRTRRRMLSTAALVGSAVASYPGRCAVMMSPHNAGPRPVRGDGAGGGRLRTVRVRLMLLVLLPMVGLFALAAGQASTATAVLSDAARGVRVADAATASAGLIHELEREL